MKSPLPKISIIMPSFNQGRYLEAAIQSILSQSYPNKELILIDGGSTDQSVEIIQRYQSKLAYSISEPDRGQTHALNKAMAHVTGEIIGWLNSDDFYLPGAFDRIVKAFRHNADAILVHGDRVMIDSNGHVSGWSNLPAFDPATSGFIVCSDTAFWRKTDCEGVHFNESLRFAMDLDYFSRLYRRGRFVKLNSYLGAFRCHSESKSATIEDVGLIEAERQWKSIFPEHPNGWRNGPKINKGKHLLRLLQHPILIAFPYLYRRFYLGLRGMATGAPR